jgi:hypothetical protein
VNVFGVVRTPKPFISILSSTRLHRPRNLVTIPGESKVLSLLHGFHTESGIHPDFYSMGTAGCFPMDISVDCEADHPFNLVSKLRMLN